MEFTSRDEVEESKIRKGHPVLYSICQVVPKRKKKESVKNASLGYLSGIKGNISTSGPVNLKCCADVEQRSRDLLTTLGGR